MKNKTIANNEETTEVKIICFESFCSIKTKKSGYLFISNLT